MGRLLILLILGCIALRMLTGKWPWAWWAVSQRSQDEAQARALLGLHRNATRIQIEDAHRRLLIRAHPDRGGSNEAVHQANNARDLLLTRAARSETEKA
jgi:DnaJ family protein C protein 19